MDVNKSNNKNKNMLINFNVGLLGHVDSGKTSLARSLSSIASTAAFDKNPQSKERGITLDLGFSALQLDAKQVNIELPDGLEQLQFTFVDCPGHASLIRTIIGGAQIIDLMILVIDVQKGIQTQTAECIVIGELLHRKLIVVINKIDLLDDIKQLEKLNSKIRKTLAKTTFGGEVPIYNVSATCNTNMQSLLDGICSQFYLPKRNVDAPLLIYVDHCFSIKGQGTICTGTIVQGQLRVNDLVEIPSVGEQRKIKSIQMFRRPVQSAIMGDRVGFCIPQFNAQQLERGVVVKPGYLQPIYAACICVNHIAYYKYGIKSKCKFHITSGHDTVMASITLFQGINNDNCNTFVPTKEYEYVEEILDNDKERKSPIFALLEFETPILTSMNAILIASKLDIEVNHNCCRLAFWGNIQWLTHSKLYTQELSGLKIFQSKLKQGSIQRVINEKEVIVHNLFKKESSNRQVYIGKRIILSTGEEGIIESTFGKTAKVKVNFPEGLKEETLRMVNSSRSKEVVVLLRHKKYIFNKDYGVLQ